jgi:hypothetical protein
MGSCLETARGIRVVAMVRRASRWLYETLVTVVRLVIEAVCRLCEALILSVRLETEVMGRQQRLVLIKRLVTEANRQTTSLPESYRG